MPNPIKSPTQNPAPNNSHKWLVPVVVLILIVAIYAGVVMYNKRSSGTGDDADESTNAALNTNTNGATQSNATNNNTTNNSVSSNRNTNSRATNTSTYKDGTYSATGSYTSPAGKEEVEVVLSIKDGVVKSSIVTPKAVNPTSIKFQGQFVDNYKPLVMGKDIDTLNLIKVSGSSLTPKGFNAALEQIKTQAKA